MLGSYKKDNLGEHQQGKQHQANPNAEMGQPTSHHQKDKKSS